MAYEPTTDVGRALGALVSEVLGTVSLPGYLKPALPYMHGQVDKMLAGVDADPGAAVATLRPFLARVARAVGLTADDLAADLEEAS